MMRIPIPVTVYKILGINPATVSNHSSLDLSYDTLALIVELVPALSDHGHNECPTIGELLEFLEPHRHETSFSGYLISAERDDERISIDAICTTNNARNRAKFCHADEFDGNDDSLTVWYD
jgi:hypothetical protein